MKDIFKDLVTQLESSVNIPIANAIKEYDKHSDTLSIEDKNKIKPYIDAIKSGNIKDLDLNTFLNKMGCQ